jgi:shikimate kinase
VARLVLVGLPGVGKTTLAAVLAEQWRCSVVDTDDLIAIAEGEPAAQYLREHGEEEFRRCELEALRGALASDAVVATGAGVVTTAPARAVMTDQTVVWLDCDDEILAERVGPGERPLLGDDHVSALARLRKEREPWYESVARCRVDASGTPDEVASRVQDALASETL